MPQEDLWRLERPHKQQQSDKQQDLLLIKWNVSAKLQKNAGTILGRDVTDSFNRLTRGAAIKAEPELLDELGIIVRINDAAEAYGRTIGKNAQDLTQFEKSQAVVNAVLEQGESKFDDVGDSVNQVAKFGAAFQDTFKKLSEPVAAIANFIAGALQDSIIAVSAVIGLLGLNIVKAFAPAGPALKNTAEEGISAQKTPHGRRSNRN